MLTKCAKSCPAGCPYPLGGKGPKVTAVVRDAWLQDDLGAFVAVFKAHLVEPHEARWVCCEIWFGLVWFGGCGTSTKHQGD